MPWASGGRRRARALRPPVDAAAAPENVGYSDIRHSLTSPYARTYSPSIPDRRGGGVRVVYVAACCSYSILAAIIAGGIDFELTAVELDEYFENPWVRLCGFYRQMEECWLGALRPGNLLIRPFDDLQARPLELILDIHRLIGVDAEERFVPLANKGRNESEASDGVPEPWLSRLREVYADEMQYWNERFGLNWK